MMDEGAEALEDGEIQDTEKMSFMPDPFLLSRATREPQRICSDESSIENSENSDDDSDACSKPKKVKPLPPAPPSRPQVPNKYKVWSVALQEEALMENLTKCDVEAIGRERDVESYNYKLSDKTDYRNYQKQERPECQYLDEDFLNCHEGGKHIVGSKRRHGDIKKRLGKRKDNVQYPVLPSLTVTVENSVEEVAEEIAMKLREPKVDLILNVVLVLGKEKAIELYNETKGVEDNGGIMLPSGERRRTSGGVYLLLIKRDNSIKATDMKAIFADDVAAVYRKKRKISKQRYKRKAAQLKEILIREKLLQLNTTVDAQEELKQSQTLVAGESNNLEEGEIELSVSNPPPSPATDQDTPPSRAHAYSEDETEHVRQLGVVQSDNLGRSVVSYGDDDDDDDYLDVGLDIDEMDVF